MSTVSGRGTHGSPSLTRVSCGSGPDGEVGLSAFEAAFGRACRLDVGGGPTDAFRGKLRAWSNGRAALCVVEGSGFRWRRDSREIRDVPFDGLLVRPCRAASVWRDASGEDQACAAGDVLILGLASPFDLRTSSGVREIWFCIPHGRLAKAAELRPPVSLKLEANGPFAGVLGATLTAFADRAGTALADEFDVLCDSLVGMAGVILAAAMRGEAAGEDRVPLDTFVAAQRFVDRNLSSASLDLDMVARSLGLSRSSVYRLFKPVGGLASYVRVRRLERAYADIAAARLADKRIGTIAFAHGFKNFSAFSRAFRENFGETPGQVRKAAGQGRTTDFRANWEAVAPQTFADLLIRLR